jgi:hypothetical protein
MENSNIIRYPTDSAWGRARQCLAVEWSRLISTALSICILENVKGVL